MKIYTIECVKYAKNKRTKGLLYFNDYPEAADFINEYIGVHGDVELNSEDDRIAIIYYNDHEIADILKRRIRHRENPLGTEVIRPAFYYVPYVTNDGQEKMKVYCTRAEAECKVAELQRTINDKIEIWEIPFMSFIKPMRMNHVKSEARNGYIIELFESEDRQLAQIYANRRIRREHFGPGALARGLKRYDLEIEYLDELMESPEYKYGGRKI